MLLGGMVRRDYRSLVGFLTEDNLRQMHADRLFLGTSGVRPGGQVMDTTVVEVPVKRAMIAASDQVVLRRRRRQVPRHRDGQGVRPGGPRRRGDQRAGATQATLRRAAGGGRGGDRRGAMRLTILGGGGFRVPLVYRALLGDRAEGRVTESRCTTSTPAGSPRSAGCSPSRPTGVADAPGSPPPPTSTRRSRGADFVFSAIRVGGLEGRAADERVALARGRARPGDGRRRRHLLRPAHGPGRRRHRPAGRRGSRPDAWVINFTNPAGLVTEAMSRAPRRPGHRHLRLAGRAWAAGSPRALGVDPATASARLRRASTTSAGCAACASTAATCCPAARRPRQRSAPSRRAGSSAPTGCARSARSRTSTCTTTTSTARRSAPTSGAEQTRGAVPAASSRPASTTEHAARPDAARSTPGTAPALEREATYMAENREAAGTGERDADDLESGGYEKVALALMRAIARDERTTLILNVRNRGTLAGARRRRRRRGALPRRRQRRPPGRRSPRCPTTPSGLVCCGQGGRARGASTAAIDGSRAAALQALALHPLVDSVARGARRLLDDTLGPPPRAGLPRLRLDRSGGRPDARRPAAGRGTRRARARPSASGRRSTPPRADGRSRPGRSRRAGAGRGGAGRATYEPFAIGTPWGPPWSTTWFRVHGRVPAEWAGRARRGGDRPRLRRRLAGQPGRGAGVRPGRRADQGRSSRATSYVPVATQPRAASVVACWSRRRPTRTSSPTASCPTPLGDKQTAGDAPLYRLARADLAVLDERGLAPRARTWRCCPS